MEAKERAKRIYDLLAAIRQVEYETDKHPAIDWDEEVDSIAMVEIRDTIRNLMSQLNYDVTKLPVLD